MRSATVLVICVTSLIRTGIVQADLWSKEEIRNKSNKTGTIPNEFVAQENSSRQGGDQPETAVTIPGFPFSDSGSTAGLNNDSGGFSSLASVLCPVQGFYEPLQTGFGPDTWYSFDMLQQEFLQVDLCGSLYDTSVGIYVQTGLPVQPQDLVALNDDDCGLASRLTCELPVGSYYLCVSGWDTSFGDYVLEMALGAPGSCDELPEVFCGDVIQGSTVELQDLLGNLAPDALFTIDIPQEMLLQLSTCSPSTDFDTYLRVFQDCALQGGLELGTNDDFCGLQSELTLLLQPGAYTIVVEGFASNSGQFELSIDCITAPFSIPQCYQYADALLEQPITIEAFSTDDESMLLVDDWELFQIDTPMDEELYMWLGGVPILPEDQGGARIEAQGTLSLEPDTPSGTELRLDIVNYTVLTAPVPDDPWAAIDWHIPASCDSCKFGLLFSGGKNAGNNHPRYWNNLADVYCMKRGEGYCADNLDVLYYKGTRRNNQIPAARVDTCTAEKIKERLVAIAAKVGACKRAGKTPKLEVYITNHGQLVGGQAMITLLDNNKLHPDSLTAWIQMVVDSGATAVELEATQCYGGGTVNSLRNKLARTDSCEVTAASATDSAHCARSKGGPGGYSRWGRPWVEGRRDSLSLQEAIRRANEAYDERLRNQNTTEEVGRGQYYRNIPSSGRCDSMQIQVTPGGHIDIEFHGDSANCGNCTVYCQRKSDSKYIKLKQWNWNIPGSVGFHTGQNKRRIDADTSGTGMYIIHNNNGPMRLEVSSHNSLSGGRFASRETSPGNPEEFAGFSMGWRNTSSAEFGILSGAALTVVDGEGLSLGALPASLGNTGVGSLQIDFAVLAQNPWWEDMVLSLTVVATSGSPQLEVSLPGAEIASQQLGINFPGEWLLPLGAIAGTGTRQLTLTVTGGSLELDCWDLHSQLSTWPLLDVILSIDSSSDDILLSWSTSPAASQYRIESAAFAGAPWTTLATVVTTAYTDSGAAATPSTKLYRVIAVE